VRFGRPRKLTAHQRDEALHRLAQGETQADIARSYAVDLATISRVVAGSPSGVFLRNFRVRTCQCGTSLT